MGVIFDGHDLSQGFIVSDVARPAPVLAAETADVPGRDGTVFRSATLEPLTVSMTLLTRGGDRESRRAAIRELMGWLDVDEPKALSFPDDGGLYYLAIPNGGGKRASYYEREAVEVEFLVPDPVMYGEAKTATLPSGGAVEVEVGGNYPAAITITAASAGRDASSLKWGVGLDSGHYLLLPMPSATGAVVVDCGQRRASVAGALVLPTIGSTWLRLTPGQHTVSMAAGTGDATVSWVERWV